MGGLALEFQVLLVRFTYSPITPSSAWTGTRIVLHSFSLELQAATSTPYRTFYVGVDATAQNNGEFFIGDAGTAVSGDSTKRLIMDNSGNIVLPTDNTGSIGTADKRWSLIKGATVESGDLAFENSYRVTEDETDGLAFKNPEGDKIAVLDRQGNFHIKGKVMEDL